MKILTLNTWKCDGAYRKRLELMQSYIAALSPDLILLQEAFQIPESDVDTAQVLASALNMQLAWVPARRKIRSFEGQEVDSFSGMAVLSRYAFSHNQAINLATDPRDGERFAQLAITQIGVHKVVIANIHLSYLADREDLRTLQIQSILENPDFQDTHALRLIAGDYNARPESTTLALAQKDPFRGKNIFHLAYGDEFPLPATIGEVCIDYILLLPYSDGTYARVHKAEVLWDFSDENLRPSDHAGVYAELTV